MSFPSAVTGYKGNYGPAGSSVNQGKIPGYKVSQIPQMGPEQMNLFKALFGAQPGIEAGIGQLSRLAQGDEGQFSQLEAPAYSAFNRGIGNIASRFSGQGLGGQKSSAFQNAVAGAAGDLGENLQSRRLALQQMAIQQLLGLGSQLLGQKTHENIITEKPQSFLQSLLGGLLGQTGGLAQMGGKFFGGL